MSALTLDRRNFLRSGAGAIGGLLIGCYLPERRKLLADTPAAANKLSAWILVGNDDTVTFFIHKAEMGQGTVTSLSMLLAEELECDWSKIRTEFPGVDPAYGPFQGVVGSQSIRSSYISLRQAGASARVMLIAAAAQKWGVQPSACRAEKSTVVNTATNARLTYGNLAEAAAKLPVPGNVPLKDPAQFEIVGKPRKRLDTPGKVDGSTRFGIDVRLPNMLYAVVERCPVFGGTVASFDDTKTKTTPGVKHAVKISNGVAVIADSTWAAMEGRRKLTVQWDEGAVAAHSTPDITKSFADAAAAGAPPLRHVGDAAGALASSAKKLDAVYQTPYLAHAPMEPLNCTAWVRPDGAEVWVSTQMQTLARQIAAQKSGLAPEKVQVHTEYMGGGFGRRGGVDYIGEAVEVAKSVDVPVKVTWSREDDMRHDNYRPASYCRFSGGLDAEGWPVAWTASIACPAFAGANTSTEGVRDNPYAIANFAVDYHDVNPGVPVSYWRSVGYSQNCFFAESFLDEMAHAGGKDPLEVRRKFLAKNPRLLAALELAAEKAEWGKPLPAGHGRGVSVVNNVGSNTVQIAEVSVAKGKVKVHRVVCAVDCGAVVNPAGVAQQMASGIAFGLSALKSGVTIRNGRVEQGNFNQYDVVRMDEMPKVEVHIVPSQAAPGGIGEASTPGAAPAVCNAIFAATGKRIRQLPIRAEDLA
ncbi:MAG TPA: xanthine dehydrogenase family protein molybdopterin-binding subunit [Bryobacteraceae bacterium]|jgi:isoquinoline 1-oxidoreductase beta subunit|nr:xanthine dehydrogenase family protein molybdopterin-binding subunit [Bryobacteraceae bacterium]